MRGTGIHRFIFSAHAWQVTVDQAINQAISHGATSEACEDAFMRNINDQNGRGLAWLGFTQLVRERIAEMQQKARERAANPPEPKPEPEPEPKLKAPLMNVQRRTPVYRPQPGSSEPRKWFTVELVGEPDDVRRADTESDARQLGKQMQDEWLAKHAEPDQADQADEPKPSKPSDALRAVEGMTGVYAYPLASGGERFAAKWPDASKANGMGQKRGFDTADEAAAYRTEQTTSTSTEAIAA